jgi:predicted alpha/beta-fold hydrolase
MIYKSEFQPPWWLTNAHLQTLWPFLFRPRPQLATRRERLELPDGDFLDLDFTLNESGPVVLVLHGLQGSYRSKYAAGLLHSLAAHGYRAVLMHFRGCSGEPNRLPHSYHSGETRDPAFVIEFLQTRFPAAPLAAIGFSLGGNALLKLLAERGPDCGLHTAVAVSVPFLLNEGADRFNRGLSRIYRQYLLRSLVGSVMDKHERIDLSGKINLDLIRGCTDFWTFDHEVTARLNGFKDVHDYYRRSSSRGYLHLIKTPTLILHAEDDPFMTPATVPRNDELSSSVRLELSNHGGHVGFVTGNNPFGMRYWLDERILRHLNDHLK